MSLDACADLVRRGDADRWAAVLAAPARARPVLIPIYAANLEIARAPFAATEPMIAEMRVQWWVDALAEIASGAAVRAHEVTTPLAKVLPPDAARDLIRLAEARRRDCWNSPFETPSDLTAYLARTGGALMEAAARACGADEPDAARTLGTASGLANYLLARPELAARGRDLGRAIPAATLSVLARDCLAAARAARARGPATLAAFLAPAVLSRAARDPSAIDTGRLRPSEFRRRAALLGASFTAG